MNTRQFAAYKERFEVGGLSEGKDRWLLEFSNVGMVSPQNFPQRANMFEKIVSPRVKGGGERDPVEDPFGFVGQKVTLFLQASFIEVSNIKFCILKSNYPDDRSRKLDELRLIHKLKTHTKGLNRDVSFLQHYSIEDLN